MTAADKLLNRLSRVRRIGDNRFVASCPGPTHVHGDRSRGLSGRIFANKIALKCFAGCSTEDILKAMGLNWQALFLDGGIARRPDPDADRRRRAEDGLRRWRHDETRRLGQDLRSRDALVRSADERVRAGELTETAAWTYLEFAYFGYSELEHRWQVLLSEREHPDTLKFWREARGAA